MDKTDSRKAKEIFLSLRLERFLTKDEILTAYLNKVPFGTGNSGYNLYGIKAAAKGIFNITDLTKLNIAQSAYLAGLPQRPSAYTAFTSKGKFNEGGFTLALERQQTYLSECLKPAGSAAINMKRLRSSILRARWLSQRKRRTPRSRI